MSFDLSKGFFTHHRFYLSIAPLRKLRITCVGRGEISAFLRLEIYKKIAGVVLLRCKIHIESNHRYIVLIEKSSAPQASGISNTSFSISNRHIE